MDRRDLKQLRLIRDYLVNEHTPLAQRLPEEVRRWLTKAVDWRITHGRQEHPGRVGSRAA